ncbi:hypothetical protein HG536_0D05820 [Torulaspora globosa]|uniref:ER membrane protein complex subunit 4 n=1 Tax=Torulaspora globosa TaxID=48254 RepID=A0A7G3ZHS5_9SACH|nr:uncharacterized protein HG536_0D05820 [Torulaspora globosa]QLL33061.1 hypothetical protein HG536_0D05820 [Torulaspora globosa]
MEQEPGQGNRMEPNPEEWAVNLVDPRYIKGLAVAPANRIPDPPGFKVKGERESTWKPKGQSDSGGKRKDIEALQLQKAWQIALQPAKAIPMNLFMSYMSGTSLQIIPIMTALMLLSGPIKAIFGVRKAFKPVLGNSATESQITAAMAMYIIFQMVLMFIGLRKLNSMGLIPNTRSDWLSWEKRADYNKGIRSFIV